MKNKKILALLLTVALIVSMLPAMAFAAPIDTHKFVLVMGTKAFEQRAINAANKDAIRQALVANGNKFHWVRGDGKIVDSRGQFVDPATMPKDITLTKVDGTTEIINESGSTPIGDLKVLEISAINKTSITVLLSKDPQQAVPASFFRVEGAKLVSVAPGTFSAEKFPYELTIESLDGKKGTVKVNGMSKEYNFETELKAKVESVTFDNYRQFHVTFSEEVDPMTAIDPANYYFEIVEGDAGKLGALPELSNKNNLEEIAKLAIELPPSVKWFDWTDKTKTKRHNIEANVESGKTVVSIKLPEKARFAGPHPIEAQLSKTPNKKKLDKDVTTFVAVRNVKNKDGHRKIDTAVFPMTIKDTVAPKAVKGYKLMGDKSLEAFDLDTSTIIEVPILGAGGDESKILVEYDEPVKKTAGADREILYVDGVAAEPAGLEFEAANGATDSPYSKAQKATINIKASRNGTPNLKPGDVFNFKLVGVKDLADNVSVPASVTFTVKMVAFDEATDTPEIKDAVQVADNIIRLEWNMADAMAEEIVIYKPDGTEDVVNAKLKLVEPSRLGQAPANHKSEKDLESGKFFSYVVLNATDKANSEQTDAQKDQLGYEAQAFINRKIVVTKLKVGAGAAVPNSRFEKELRLEKDILAPVLTESAINNLDTPPTTYEEVGTEVKLLVKMKDMIPFSTTKELKQETYVMKQDGTVIAALGTDDLKKVLVSYKKDGMLRRYEIDALKQAAFVNDVLTIDLATLKGGAHVTELLDANKKLVEGATYTVEFPEMFFVDHKLTTGSDFATKPNDQEWIDAKRNADFGFGNIAFKVEFKVPDSKTVESDIVPQTSIDLIGKVDEPSTNRQQINIEFKGSIDPATLKDPQNYTLNGKTLAAWGMTSDDIEYRLDGPDEQTAKKFALFYAPAGSVEATGDVEIIVANVANKLGAKMTPVVTKITLKDNTAPKALTSRLDGSKKIAITFDEALKRQGTSAAAAGKNFIVKSDDKIVGVISADKDASNARILVLELADDVSATSKITVEVVKDQNGDILITDATDNPLMEKTVINVQ